MSTEDEQRAAAYRAQVARRAAFQRFLRSNLRGSRSARQALGQNWLPLALARLDAKGGTAGGPPDGDAPQIVGGLIP